MSVAIALADLVAISLFILGLRYLSSPPTARFGNRLAAAGMLIALIGVVVQTTGVGWWAIAIGVAIGGTLLVLGDQRTHRPGSVHRCSAEALMPGMTTSSPVRNCAAV